MRLKSIDSRLNTCTHCNFKALFFYGDALGVPLCPKCHADDIQEFKELSSNINDDLECDIDDLDSDSFNELDFSDFTIDSNEY